MLLDGGQIVSRSKPTYADYAVSDFSSAKAAGAKGDGDTDDTAALQAWIDADWGCKLLYLDAGTYLVSDTITIPAGTQILGEAWSTILGYGSAFHDQKNPKVVIKVGEEGSSGVTEISDIVFGTRGPGMCSQSSRGSTVLIYCSAPGAIVVEWNVRDPDGQQGVAAAWDTHVRLGGAAGTSLTDVECPTLTNSTLPKCFAAFLGFHLTSGASAYLEGLWVWLADHALDGTQGQVSIYSGRGLLSESQGPVWLIGTGSEHHVLYQYSFVDAANHYGGLMQTETPYYQPVPAPPAPFVSNSAFHDPVFEDIVASWALWVENSHGILVYGVFSLLIEETDELICFGLGAGFYSFFINYNQTCIGNFNCQDQIVNIDCDSDIHIYQLSTVGTTHQLSVGESPVINQADNRDG